MNMFVVLFVLWSATSTMGQTFDATNGLFGDLMSAEPEKAEVESDSSSDNVENAQMFESFNRPEGTVALETPIYSTPGITSGTYGSYRKHNRWQQAVSSDVLRHQLLHGRATGRHVTQPWWLLRNLHKPSLVGFGLNGFWNSYAPTVPGAGGGAGMGMVFNSHPAAKTMQAKQAQLGLS